MDIGRNFAYNHAVPQRSSVETEGAIKMAKKLKKGKKIAPKRSLKKILDKV